MVVLATAAPAGARTGRLECPPAARPRGQQRAAAPQRQRRAARAELAGGHRLARGDTVILTGNDSNDSKISV